MKAEEIRIHNKVSITQKARKELWEMEMDVKPLSTGFITSIDLDECRIILDGQEYEMYFEDLEPIPLSEEWLLKFGFENTDKKVFEYHKYPFTVRAGFKVGFGHISSVRILREIKYVHELQNLVFSITGNDLTLNH